MALTQFYTIAWQYWQLFSSSSSDMVIDISPDPSYGKGIWSTVAGGPFSTSTVTKMFLSNRRVTLLFSRLHHHQGRRSCRSISTSPRSCNMKWWRSTGRCLRLWPPSTLTQSTRTSSTRTGRVNVGSLIRSGQSQQTSESLSFCHRCVLAGLSARSPPVQALTSASWRTRSTWVQERSSSTTSHWRPSSTSESTRRTQFLHSSLQRTSSF